MSYCLLQTLLLGAVLFFFKLVNQLMLAEVPLQLKPIVNPVLVIPLLCKMISDVLWTGFHVSP